MKRGVTNMERRLADLEKKFTVTKGDRWGEGWTGGWRLACAHSGLWNDWPMGTCCIAQGTLPSIPWSSIWEKNLRENECVSMGDWVTLSYSRNDHSLVN